MPFAPPAVACGPTSDVPRLGEDGDDGDASPGSPQRGTLGAAASTITPASLTYVSPTNYVG